MKKVFIDGSQGTTGLRIHDRLSGRDDISLITLPEEERKNLSSRVEAINSADISFLCLPDEAAREIAAKISENVRILDTSTAHRTSEQWIYGFPEVFSDGAERIKNASRVAVPGCHASGFIALVKPLVDEGILPKDALISCHAITGYSGGGKKMIAEYESDAKDPLLRFPRQYALNQQHKHLKEMSAVTGLENFPLFSPIVSDFYSGMVVTVPLFRSQIRAGDKEIMRVYKERYRGPVVTYSDEEENGFISAGKLSGKDKMEITVKGNDDRILLIARYDNLGKGASGAAVECLNIMLGTDKTKGLDL